MKNSQNDSKAIKVWDEQGKEIAITHGTIEVAVDLLRTLNNTYRQRIIRLLELEDELSVTEIYIKLNLDQSVASQHLSMLRRHQLMRTKRSGKHVIYSLNRARFMYISEMLSQLLKR